LKGCNVNGFGMGPIENVQKSGDFDILLKTVYNKPMFCCKLKESIFPRHAVPAL